VKKLWEKVTQALAWVGAGALSALALIGAFLVLRRKENTVQPENPVFVKIKHSEELAAAHQTAKDLEHEINLGQAAQQIKDKGAALERDPVALATELTRLSD
jgi:LPXTG-motif cell wall-anchored protein